MVVHVGVNYQLIIFCKPIITLPADFGCNFRVIMQYTTHRLNYRFSGPHFRSNLTFMIAMFFSGHQRLWLEWPSFEVTQATQACMYLHHQHNLVPQVLAKQIQLGYSIITSASAFGACLHTHFDISRTVALWGCSPWIARRKVWADSGKPDTIIGPNLKIRLNLSRSDLLRCRL